MLDNIRQAETMIQGGFIALVGLIGVFMVLILFFAAIKALQKIDRAHKDKNGEDTDN